MIYQVHNPGEQHLHYNIKKCKKQGSLGIINDISENVTLVQLMDTVGNVNNSVSIVVYLIFYFYCKNSLKLTLDSLNLVCSPSVGEGIFSMFKIVFCAVIYINNRVKLKIFD